MGWYEAQVLPRVIDRVLRGEDYSLVRARVAAGMNGQVLEIGFGSGLNIPHYPPEVTRVVAVDPATTGRKLAAERLRKAVAEVEFAGLDAGELPADAGTVDHVLSTWTLCTVPDPRQALAEIWRVLRPGGSLHFAEHGLSPDSHVAKRQHRLTPLQRRLVGGCHLNRPIAELISSTGFEMSRLDNYYMRGSRTLGYTFEGVAVRP